MNAIPPASFQFISFLVTESHLTLHRAESYDFQQLGIVPSGIIHPAKNQFQLQLKFEAIDAGGKADIKLTVEAVFAYTDIPDVVNSRLLTENAPAIVFPYLRAYVSTLTIQAGIPPIVLPTLNLSGMAEFLKQNITVRHEELLT